MPEGRPAAGGEGPHQTQMKQFLPLICRRPAVSYFQTQSLPFPGTGDVVERRTMSNMLFAILRRIFCTGREGKRKPRILQIQIPARVLNIYFLFCIIMLRLNFLGLIVSYENKCIAVAFMSPEKLIILCNKISLSKLFLCF